MDYGCCSPRITTTGTTIVGLRYKNGVVLAADTRASQSMTITDKVVSKLYCLGPNI